MFKVIGNIAGLVCIIVGAWMLSPGIAVIAFGVLFLILAS